MKQARLTQLVGSWLAGPEIRAWAPQPHPGQISLNKVLYSCIKSALNNSFSLLVFMMWQRKLYLHAQLYEKHQKWIQNNIVETTCPEKLELIAPIYFLPMSSLLLRGNLSRNLLEWNSVFSKISFSIRSGSEFTRSKKQNRSQGRSQGKNLPKTLWHLEWLVIFSRMSEKNRQKNKRF